MAKHTEYHIMSETREMLEFLKSEGHTITVDRVKFPKRGFNSFDALCEWIEKQENKGFDREQMYITRNDPETLNQKEPWHLGGGNAGNVMAQGGVD